MENELNNNSNDIKKDENNLNEEDNIEDNNDSINKSQNDEINKNNINLNNNNENIKKNINSNENENSDLENNNNNNELDLIEPEQNNNEIKPISPNEHIHNENNQTIQDEIINKEENYEKNNENSNNINNNSQQEISTSTTTTKEIIKEKKGNSQITTITTNTITTTYYYKRISNLSTLIKFKKRIKPFLEKNEIKNFITLSKSLFISNLNEIISDLQDESDSISEKINNLTKKNSMETLSMDKNKFNLSYEAESLLTNLTIEQFKNFLDNNEENINYENTINIFYIFIKFFNIKNEFNLDDKTIFIENLITYFKNKSNNSLEEFIKILLNLINNNNLDLSLNNMIDIRTYYSNINLSLNNFNNFENFCDILLLIIKELFEYCGIIEKNNSDAYHYIQILKYDLNNINKKIEYYENLVKKIN